MMYVHNCAKIVIFTPAVQTKTILAISIEAGDIYSAVGVVVVGVCLCVFCYFYSIALYT